MWIRLTNTTAFLVRSTDEEKNWLRDYLAFSDQRLRFKRGGGSSSSKDSMFTDLTNSFPAGLLTLVKQAAAEEKLGVDVDDQRSPQMPRDPAASLEWLRDYQLEAVDRVSVKERGIVWAPTGSGKTEIIVGVVLRIPCRWLLLVHRTNLMEQAAERYEKRTGNLAGRIGEGVWDPSTDAEGLTCATFQTIAAALASDDTDKIRRAQELLLGADALAVDECHTLPADSFWRVAMAARNARIRVGFSGTPLARGDRRSVLAIAALGPVIYRIKAQRLIDEGVLAKPKIRMIEIRHKPTHETWAGVRRECIDKGVLRNNAIVQAAVRCAKPAFLFVQSIAHGKAMEKLLWKNGVRASFVWGSYSIEARARMVRDLVKDRIDVLVCNVVFQEGVDVPELRSVIVASGGRSVIAALQRLGRGMRIERDAQGNVVKDQFEAWDILDRGCGCKVDSVSGKHKGCAWLERHARERLTAYATEGYETVVEPCTVR